MKAYSMWALVALIGALGFMGGCGASDKEASDPKALLAKVQGSQYGVAYTAYKFFSDVKWTPTVDQQKGPLIQFDGLYDLNKIKRESCAKKLEEKGPEFVKDLEKISQMTHNAMFGVKDGKVDFKYSGWSLKCSNGVEKHFPDPEGNTQREISSNTWQTDCESLLEIATKGCEK